MKYIYIFLLILIINVTVDYMTDRLGLMTFSFQMGCLAALSCMFVVEKIGTV